MTQNSYPALFSSAKIGPTDLKNRYVVAPMTRVSAEGDGTPNDAMIDYYRAYAEGGFGLVITEGSYIDEAHSQGYFHQGGQANAKHVAGWRKITDAVHAAGAPIIQQLLHAGALAQGNRYTGEAIAPVTLRPDGEQSKNYFGDGPYEEARGMSQSDIDAVVEAFGAAAARAMEAGFDGVEIHGANGYLVDQFLTDYTNTRDDGYGGSLENRLRFPCEVLKSVIDGIAGRGSVGIRISQFKINNFTNQWAGGAEDAKVIFSTLAAVGPDYLHMSTRDALQPVWDSGRNFGAHAKEYSGLPIMAVGQLEDAAKADALIASGEADFCAVAKGALADPALPNKSLAGDPAIPFDPGMTLPVATIYNTAEWKAANLPSSA